MINKNDGEGDGAGKVEGREEEGSHKEAWGGGKRERKEMERSGQDLRAALGRPRRREAARHVLAGDDVCLAPRFNGQS